MPFTVNFDLEQFERVSDGPLTLGTVSNAEQLAPKLERVRSTFNVPLILTSFVRRGSEGQHGDGSAIDFEPEWRGDLNPRTWFDRVSTLAQSGALGTFGQLIFYPFSDDHTHLSLGTRRQILIASADEKHFEAPSPGLVSQIPGSVVAGAGGLLLVGAMFLFMNPKRKG